MADSTTGFDRNIESYSPLVSGDRVPADRPQRLSTTSSEGRDGNAQDLASLIKLGSAKLEMGDAAAATEFFRKALEMGDRTLGPDHPDLILLLNDLTRLYLKQSAHAAAEPLLLRLLDMKRSKGEDHPEVATVLASLAAVRQALGRHESAEQLCRRVLDIRERTLAPNHFAIATALEHLGDVCAARGNIPEALPALQRAQTIRERTLGSGHPSLRTSRERIADLQLQASENSLDPASDILPVPAPERYRLLSGEPVALTNPPSRTREHSTPEQPPAATLARQTRVRIQHVFSDVPPNAEETLVSKEAVVKQADVLQQTAVTFADEAPVPHRDDAASYVADDGAVYRDDKAAPFREALESIREELERPYVTPSLAERSGLILESVIEFLGRKQVIAGIVVVVLGLLSLAVARDSRAGAEVDFTPVVATPASHDPPAVNVAAKNTSGQPATLRRESGNVPASTVANTSAKNPAPKARAVEQRDTPKRAAEARTESKKIVIPALSTGMMSRLDSVAARAADASSRLGDPFPIQPAVSDIGNHRSSFDYSEQSSAPQRARLVGELPTPRLPDHMGDIEGEVRVRFNVDTDGVPVMSTFAVVNSPSPLLTLAVRKVIPEMRFEPARAGGPDGKPIVDVVQIGFQFSRARR